MTTEADTRDGWWVVEAEGERRWGDEICERYAGEIDDVRSWDDIKMDYPGVDRSAGKDLSAENDKSVILWY